jgi:hypothetical protein
MEERSARTNCESKLRALEQLDEQIRDNAYNLVAMFTDFLLANAKGAGSIPVSSAGSSTPAAGTICPKCKQSVRVMLS